VEAHRLAVGETVRTRDGSGARVLGLERLPGVHAVFNLEVEGLHQYHVSPLGLLAHNNNKCESTNTSAQNTKGANEAVEAGEDAATHGHHTIPREVRKSRSTGESMLPEHLVENPDIKGRPGNANVWDVPAQEHMDLHKKNRAGGDYNTRWKEELNGLRETKPKADWVAGDITGIRDKLAKEFKIEKYRPKKRGEK
jgi:hypothetical protein